jgi:hypothetical protein
MGANTKIEWRAVQGVEGIEVSSDGQVRTYWKQQPLGRGRGTRRVLGQNARQLQQYNRHGYRIVKVSKHEEHKVHRLVLFAFVGPCPVGHEARHLNGNPSDNRLENLVWGTAKENNADQYRHGTRVASQRHPIAKLDSDQVAEVRRRYAAGEKQKDIAKSLGIAQSTVSSMVNYKHRNTDPRETKNG